MKSQVKVLGKAENTMSNETIKFFLFLISLNSDQISLHYVFIIPVIKPDSMNLMRVDILRAQKGSLLV